MDKEIDDTGVEFDDRDKIEPSKFPHKAASVMVDWIVKHKIVKDKEQAGFLLVALSILAISLSMFIFYFGSFYAVPDEDQSTLLVPQSGNPPGVVE